MSKVKLPINLRTQLVAGPWGTGDPDFDNVVLLLPLTGDNGNASTRDASNTKHPITFVANAQLDTTQKRFATSSLLLDGTDDWLTVEDHTDFEFAAGDWTFETWVRFNGAPGAPNNNQTFAGKWDDSGGKSWVFDWFNGDLRMLYSANGSSGFFGFQTAWVPSGSIWYHVACVRDSTVMRGFVDGIQLVEDSSIGATSLANTTAQLRVGSANVPSETGAEVNGWLDNVRITKGVARYTKDFEPPQVPHANYTPRVKLPTIPTPIYPDQLLLHMDGTDESTSFVDSSIDARTLAAFGATDMDTTQIKFGTTSMYNGVSNSGNGLSVSATGGFLLFAGAFTVECFFYQTANTEFDHSTLISRVNTSLRSDTDHSTFELGVQYNSINVGEYTPYVLIFNTDTGAHPLSSPTETTLLNEWNHVAVTRDGDNTFRIFTNGVLSQSVTATGSSATLTAAATPYIGATEQNGINRRHSFRGWIDEVRVTDGVARYTENFTPPTAPFS